MYKGMSFFFAFFASFRNEFSLDKRPKCMIQMWDGVICSSLHLRNVTEDLALAEKDQKYFPSTSVHNHCRVMWPSPLENNEQFILWCDDGIYDPSSAVLNPQGSSVKCKHAL